MLDCIYSNTSFPYKKIGSVKEESICDMKMEYFLRLNFAPILQIYIIL